MRIKTHLLVAAALIALSAPLAEASDVLERARALYDAAQYRQAIELLDQSPAEAGAESQRYRALCLLALGRSEDAERAMAQIVTIDPHFVLDDGSVSPRVSALFDGVRRRTLPAVIRREFAVATELFRNGAHQEAGERFAALVRLLDEPALGAAADLAALAIAARGFVELRRAQTSRQSPPVEAPLAAATRADESPAAVIREADPPEPTFVAPVAVERTLPSWHPPDERSADREFSGAIGVSIDEAGRVVAVTRKRSIHPLYDPILLAAAREWIFRPALKDGRPVRAEVTVEVTLSPASR